MTQDRQVKIVVAADVAAAIRGLTEVSNAAGNVARSSAGAAEETKSAWDTFKESVAGQVAIGDLISKGVSGAFGAVVDGAKNMVAAGLSYEQSMNTLSAVTGANDTQMRSLGDAAKQLGNDITIPGASAGTAASAMAELAKGGLTVDQTMQAASGTLRLAAAAQIDGAEAAQIQANALNAFRLGADQADHVADVLANSANAASGEITDMAAALQQSATVAAGFGISVDDSATTLALFAKNGVLGSDAGTSFKTMLTALASPTEAQAAALEQLNLEVYDASGNFVGMESVTQQLSAAHQRLTTEQYNSAASTAFGTDAIRAANILGQEGTRGWQDMATAVSQAGGAQELAAAQSQGLTGALDRFKNSAENAALTLYEKVSPALAAMADFGATAFSWIGDAIGWFTDLPGPVQNTALALGAVAILHGPLSAIGPAISRMIGTAVLNFNALVVAIRAGTLSMASFGAIAKGALAMLGGPIGLAIIGVTTALSFMGTETDEVASSTADFSAAIDENTGALKENAPAVVAKALADSGQLTAAEGAGVAIGDYTRAVLEQGGALEQVQTQLQTTAAEQIKSGGQWENLTLQARRAKMGTDEYLTSLLASGDAGRGAELGIGNLITVYSSVTGEAARFSTQQTQVNQANAAAADVAGSAAAGITGVGDAAAQAEAAATPFGDALKDMRAAAQEADAATQFLITSLDLMDDGSISAEQATRQNAAAFREIGSAARDYAEAQQRVAEKDAELKDLSAHLGEEYKGRVITQADLDRASRELADAQNGVSDASDRQFNANLKAAESAKTLTGEAYNTAVSQGNLKGAVEAAVAKMAEQRESFIQNQVAAGMTRDAAEQLANQLNLIPENVRTTYEAPGLPGAIDELTRLRREIASIPDSKIVRVQVERGDIVYTTASGAKFQADGGYISGPGGPRDDLIPAMLSNGEYVVNAKATDRWRPLLEQINAGRYARGGIVRLAAGGAADGSKASADAESSEVSATLTAPDPELFQDSWDQIVASTETAWGSGIAPTLDLLSQGNTKTGEEFTHLDEGVVAPVWANISGNVQKAWDGTILPTYDALNQGTETGGIWQNWLRDLTAQAWQRNQASVGDATNWLVGVTFPTLNAGAQGVGAEQTNLAATTTAAWTQIGGIIQSTHTGQIVPAWTGVQSFATATGAFFQGIQAGVTGAAGTVLSEIGKIRGAISSFMQLVGGSVPQAATGGAVAALLDAKADGGPITQGTGPRSDDVLIRVSKGEYVVNAEATSRNRRVLDAMNFGGHTPAFADGGAVGEKIRRPVEDTIVNASHKAIEDAINKLVTSVGGFFSNGQWGPANPGGLAANAQAARDFIVKNWGITNIGGWRASGSVPGSDHPLGKALDVMIANYMSQAGIAQGDSVANWFIGNPNAFGTKYVIWRDRINQGGSWSPYSHPGGNNDTLAHRDHVHLSFLTGAGAFSGTPVGDTPSGGGSWLDRMLAKIGTGVPAGAAAAYNPSGGVEQWRGLGMAVLQRVGQYVGQNLTPFIGHMLNQIRTESSGNPNAINTTDINAQRGDPSIGLLQVIGSTFRNALSGTPFAGLIARGQRDPYASLVSSTLYSLRRYGSLDRAWRGVAYDTGGIWPNGTMGWNTSGGPEMVLKPWQWAAAQSAISYVTNQASGTNIQGGNHGGVHIHGNLVNNTGSDLKRELQYAAVCARG